MWMVSLLVLGLKCYLILVELLIISSFDWVTCYGVERLYNMAAVHFTTMPFALNATKSNFCEICLCTYYIVHPRF